MSDAELSDPLTLRLPRDVMADVDAVAKVSERTRSWVLIRALRHYLASEGQEILDAAEGIRQLDAGDGDDMDDVIGEVAEIVRSRAPKT